MERKSHHPPSDVLHAFGLGRLQSSEHAEVEKHVAHCDTCSELLREISGDSLLRKMQQADSLPLDDTVAHARRAEDTPRVAGRIFQQLRKHRRYRILKKLGAGGMGVVYKAQHRVMSRVVALKVIRPEMVNHPSSVERFRREVQAAAKLDHPNIVSAYDAEKIGELHLLVMEYVDGVSVDVLGKQQGRLPVATACRIIRQAALGLEHAHQHGMVHRDIKPQNLMMTTDGRIKILDFGLARVRRPEAPDKSSLTADQMAMGTPDYIAPEQAKNSRTVDARADIYGLGCTFYELLVGHPPFPKDSCAETIAAHLTEEPPPIESVRNDVPAPVLQILRRMLAKNPDDRIQSASEVAQVLAAHSGEIHPPPVTAPSPSIRSPVPPPVARQTRGDAQHETLPQMTPVQGKLSTVSSPLTHSIRNRKGARQTNTRPLAVAGGGLVVAALALLVAVNWPESVDRRGVEARPDSKARPFDEVAQAPTPPQPTRRLTEPRQDEQRRRDNDNEPPQPNQARQRSESLPDADGGSDRINPVLDEDAATAGAVSTQGNPRSAKPDGNPRAASADENLAATSSSAVAAAMKTGRVLVVLPHDNFWYPDYANVVPILRAAGLKIEVASSGEGSATSGKKRVPVDLLLRDADAQHYDAVVFCGAPDMERNLEFAVVEKYRRQARQFIESMLAAEKYVTSICAGTAVLAEVDVLNGKSAARVSFVSPRIKSDPDIQWRHAPFVRSAPYILTGGDPHHAQAFARELVSLLLE